MGDELSSKLFGFDEIQNSLIDNFLQNKLHHGLLFSGNRGIGKASFANNLATHILLSSSQNQVEDLKKIQSSSHPDLLIITKDEKKQSIAVDAMREVSQFLNLTSAISKYRVIIIDAVDDLNKNSANAILKILEEPPTNVFLFLINHNFGKVLETIKSRCKIIKINNPNYKNFKNIIQKNISEISDEEIKILAEISNHSIGYALQMQASNAIQLYDQITQMALEYNTKAIFDLAKKVSGKDELWEIFEKLIIFYLYNQTKSLPNNNLFIISDKVANLLSTTKNLNLDKSQTVINIFSIIKNVN